MTPQTRDVTISSGFLLQQNIDPNTGRVTIGDSPGVSSSTGWKGRTDTDILRAPRARQKHFSRICSRFFADPTIFP
jgi:hypothetical protein